MSNHAETDKVLELVTKNLEKAYTSLAALKQEQSLIDAKIEDLTRVALALERTRNTLSATFDKTFETALKAEAEDVYHRALANVSEDAA